MSRWLESVFACLANQILINNMSKHLLLSPRTHRPLLQKHKALRSSPLWSATTNNAHKKKASLSSYPRIPCFSLSGDLNARNTLSSSPLSAYLRYPTTTSGRAFSTLVSRYHVFFPSPACPTWFLFQEARRATQG